MLSLHELRQHERLFLEGTAPNPICCCPLAKEGIISRWLLGRAHSGAGEAVEPELASVDPKAKPRVRSG